MKTVITSAEFFRSYSELPPKISPPLPEIAIIGRSNVGKSSFINRVLGRKALARTSSTPGRTQALVYFNVKVRHTRQGAKSLYLVDLPGFGFAKLSKAERNRLHKLIADFLMQNPQLRMICLLNDCRREPGEEEMAVRDIALESEAPLLIVFTKADKMSRNEINEAVPTLAAKYGLSPQDVIITGRGLDADAFWDRATLLL